jgi:hypothetical protein
MNRIVTITIIGGIAFWVPDLFYKLARPDTMANWDGVVLTALLPAIALPSAEICARVVNPRPTRVTCLLVFLLGIWLLGPIYAFVNSLVGVGLKRIAPWWYLLALAVFPFTTLGVSTFDRSLGGLVITSGYLGIVAIIAGLRSRKRE